MEYKVRYTAGVKVPSDLPGSDKYGNKSGLITIEVTKEEPIVLNDDEKSWVIDTMDFIREAAHFGLEDSESWMRENMKIEYSSRQRELDKKEIQKTIDGTQTKTGTALQERFKQQMR